MGALVVDYEGCVVAELPPGWASDWVVLPSGRQAVSVGEGDQFVIKDLSRRDGSGHE